MSQKIQIRRGNKINLPQLDDGELGFANDTKELFIGTGSDNVQIAKLSDVYKGIEILAADPQSTDLYEGRMWIVSEGVTFSAPVIAQYGVGSTFATIQLTTPSQSSLGDTITTYDVYLNGTVFASNVSIASNGTYQLTGLTASTTYSIYVKTTGSNIVQSNTLSVTTTGVAQTNNAPSSPVISLVSTDSSSATIQLSTASTDTEDGTITSYQVLVNGSVSASPTGWIQGTNYKITGLSASTTYTITVEGKDSGGLLSTASNSVSATTTAAPSNSVAFLNSFANGDTSLDTTNLAKATSGSATFTVVNNALQFRETSSITDGGTIYFKHNFTEETITYRAKMVINDLNGGNFKTLSVLSGTAVVPDSNTNINNHDVIDFSLNQTASGASPTLKATTRQDNSTTTIWSSSSYTLTLGTTYNFKLICDATNGLTFKLTDATDTTILWTQTTTWSNSVFGTAGNYHVYLGDPFNNYYGSMSVDILELEISQG